MNGARLTTEERFWNKVRKTETCWLWTAYITSNWSPRSSGGYGQFQVSGKHIPAHRFSYELLVGPIPDGLTIDHLCRIRHCVRPSHLEPVSLKENILRGIGITASQAKRSHCIHGHEFDIQNTYKDAKGGRVCRTCQKNYQATYSKKYYLKNRHRLLAAQKERRRA